MAVMSTDLSSSSMETTDVIICGCGPTGAMLSVQLGRQSVKHIILERGEIINTDPRGIALDEDGIRYLQACGIYDKIFTDIGQCMGKFKFISGVHSDLRKRSFMHLDYYTTEGGTGHPGFICHKQPAIEKHLRAQINSCDSAQLRVGSTVTSIQEDEDWVYATYSDTLGKSKTVRGRFLVGADGKTGFTRKMYLEPRGIMMEKVSDLASEQVWVALNWKLTLPTSETHPDFPLWAKGYSPQQVYDLFFPIDFRFLCNHQRPAICSRFGLPEDYLWRFEFLVSPDEDGEVLAGPNKMREIVFPYITHKGSDYGLSDVDSIQFPEDCIEVLRSRPFTFSARSCNRWAHERVILCGDAAHVFPPFGGQGIASGFRDAISLAWRLTLATNTNWQGSPATVDFRRLLTGWYLERKQQFDKSLASTIENGNYVTEANLFKIFLREWYLWALQLVPAWKHQLELGNRRDGMVKYKVDCNQPDYPRAFLQEKGGGGNFPQVYCAPIHSHGVNAKAQAGKVHFTDDIIFAPSKRGLFQVVVLLNSLSDWAQFRAMLNSAAEAFNSSSLLVEEVTYILLDTQEQPAGTNTAAFEETIYRLATGDEFAADTSLSARRPPPKYYNPFRMSSEVQDKFFVILRPDRFIFSAVNSLEDLHEAAKSLYKLYIGKL